MYTIERVSLTYDEDSKVEETLMKIRRAIEYAEFDYIGYRYFMEHEPQPHNIETATQVGYMQYKVRKLNPNQNLIVIHPDVHEYAMSFDDLLRRHMEFNGTDMTVFIINTIRQRLLYVEERLFI